MKKIIFVNLLIFIFIFLILEFASYLYIKQIYRDYIEPYNEAAKVSGNMPLNQRYAGVQVFNQKDAEEHMRPVILGNTNKKSLLFFGCSYTFGDLVEENETFPYYVAKMTGRTVINRGISCGSILNTLQDLNNSEFISDMRKYPDVEYIIYTLINDHFCRIANPYRSVARTNNKYSVNVCYKEDNGILTEKTPSKLKLFLYSLYTTKAWYFLYSQNFVSETKEQRMFKLLKGAKNIAAEEFPNAKFVIILYKDGSHALPSDEFITDLKNIGFIVLDSEELAGHELESLQWRAADKEHPNGKAFYDEAKGLVKELKL